MSGPRKRSPAAVKERRRQQRLNQIIQLASRGLDGHLDALHIRFHHDDELHISTDAYNRPPEDAAALVKR